MPSTALIQHVLNNVWCSPEQDYQLVIRPQRLTNYRGLRKTMELDWRDILLPDQTSTFHVFQIGALHPSLIGLFPRSEQWIKASDHCNIQGMVIDIYNAKGIRVPRFETWFIALSNRNLVVAIVDQGDNVKLASEDIYLRFYSNAFYESSRSDGYPLVGDAVILENPDNDWNNLGALRASGRTGDVLVEGKRCESRTELMAMQDRLARLRDLNVGKVLAFYNGRLVKDFSGAYYTTERFRVGDWAEIYLDASISEILEFKVSDLSTFDSILDSMRKYLLHRPTEVINHIQFKDDLDMYLVRDTGNDRFEGRLFYRNTAKTVRMVTHQDWAIPVPYVMSFVDEATDFTNPSGWRVQVHVRHSGYLRPLVDESSRIKELYKLSPERRSMAMLGIDSSLEFWRADNLENAMYPALMSMSPANITVGIVEEACGYNAISRLVADSPLPVVVQEGLKVVDLPMGLQSDATLFEYNTEGHLLEWHHTAGTTQYSCRNADTAFVEGRVGIGGPTLSTVFGTSPYQLNPDIDYFFMKVSVWNKTITGDWQPAVLGADYTIIDGVAYWNLDGQQWLCAIRNNKHFLTYNVDLDATDGLMIMSIQSEEQSEYEPANRVMAVPYGKLDLWLNGRPLIENIDYVVHWPQLVICNKEFISSSELQRVTVRCTGLPMVNAEGEFYRQRPLDVGFVKYGQLSRNNRYNVRDDKVQRIVVRGRVKLPQDVSYPENGAGISVAGIANGDPYAVEEVIVPVGAFVESTTDALRNQALERDRQVENYVSRFVTDPVEENANTIAERYDLFSPFLAKIIRDLQHGYLVLDYSTVPFTQAKIEEWLEDYLYLLDYDPTTLNLDDDYVNIHPHDSYQVQTLGVYEYYLVEKACQIYLQDKVNLSIFLQLDPNWAPIQTAT